MDEESDIVSDQLQSDASRLVYNRLSFFQLLRRKLKILKSYD